MHVLLVVVGSRGDVVPFEALARRLVAAGHQATVVTHRSLIPAEPGAVSWIAVDGDPESLLAGPAGRALGRLDLRALNRTRGQFAEFAASVAEPLTTALCGADVIVASTFAMAAVPIARHHGVPVVRAQLWPENALLDGPMPLLPFSWILPAGVRRMARRALRRAEPLLAGFDGWWEAGRLRIDPHYRAGMTTNDAGSLHAFSPSLMAAAAAGPRGTRVRSRSAASSLAAVTGWWTGTERTELSPRTRRLLEDDGPWIFMGFGSMPQRSPSRLLDELECACAAVDVRAVVQLPGIPAGQAGDRVQVIGPEPHQALLPRVSVAVHHGGAGTTAAAVQAGVPSVVVPHMADQFYWGHVLQQAGTAPPLLPRPFLRADRLARRIHQARAAEMAARAEALGCRTRAEDGTAAAVRFLESVARRP